MNILKLLIINTEEADITHKFDLVKPKLLLCLCEVFYLYQSKSNSPQNIGSERSFDRKHYEADPYVSQCASVGPE